MLTDDEREAMKQRTYAEMDAVIARLNESTARRRAMKLLRTRKTWPTTERPVTDTPAQVRHTFTCATCQDQGIIKVPGPSGKYGLDGWRYDLQPCHCRAPELRERKAQRIKSASNLTPEMERMTFATYDRDWDAEAYDASWNFVQHLLSGAAGFAPFLVLSGTYGSGKTHLLAAISHEAMQHGRQPMFTVVPNLLDWFKAAFGKQEHDRAQQDAYEQRFTGICDADILLLDDLGAERSTPWAQEKLFQIINHRYARRLPTVFSMNGTPDQLEGRIADRLMDLALCEQVYTVDKSFRQHQARAKQRKTTKKGA